MASFTTSYLPDEEEEERRARIAEITGAFGSDLAAGMREGGIETETTEPPPVDPRAGQLPPIAHGSRTGANALDVVDPWASESPAPRVASAPPAPPASVGGGAAMARASAQPVAAVPPLPAGAGPDMSADYERQIADLDDQQRRERRRRGIIGAILSPILGNAENARAFVDSNAGAYDDRRQRVQQMLAGHQQQRQAAAAARQEAINRMIDQRARQANADRAFTQDQAQLAYQRERDTARDARSAEEFDRTENMRAKQDELDRIAAQGRASTIAGGLGRGTGTTQPGTAPTGPGGTRAPDLGTMVDAPIIQSMIDARPEIRRAAQLEAQRRQSAGEQVDVGQLEWQLASQMFGRLPRDEQDRIRRSFMSPESTNAAVSAPVREQQQLATRVRQYGQDVQGRTEWDRTVRAATQAMQGASDEDIRIAQQWLQGGMRQAVAELSPSARQLAQRLARLQNVLLRERSGAAVTDQEFARLRGELGANWFQSPESMRAAMQDFGAASQEMSRILAATYGPDVVSAYQQNLQAAGGDAPAPQRTGGGRYRAGQVITGPGGQRVTLSQEQADRLNARGQ